MWRGSCQNPELEKPKAKRQESPQNPGPGYFFFSSLFLRFLSTRRPERYLSLPNPFDWRPTPTHRFFHCALCTILLNRIPFARTKLNFNRTIGTAGEGNCSDKKHPRVQNSAVQCSAVIDRRVLCGQPHHHHHHSAYQFRVLTRTDFSVESKACTVRYVQVMRTDCVRTSASIYNIQSTGVC